MKQNKWRKKISLCDRPLVLPPPPPHTHTKSVGLLKEVSFKWWFEGWDGVGWPDFVRESVPDRRRSIQKRHLTKRVCLYSGNTENGRWAKLAGWLIDSQEFRQVVRSSRVEALITERREFVPYSLISGQPMKRSKMRRNVVHFRNSQNKASSVVLRLVKVSSLSLLRSLFFAVVFWTSWDGAVLEALVRCRQLLKSHSYNKSNATVMELLLSLLWCEQSMLFVLKTLVFMCFCSVVTLAFEGVGWRRGYRHKIVCL